MMGCADTLLINGLLLIVPFIISLISTLVAIFLSRRLGSGHIMATGNDHMMDTGSDHMMDPESDHMMASASINDKDVYRAYGEKEPAGVTIIKEEGLHFNKRGKLVDVNGDPFVFEIYQTREENQRRYETICMGIEWFVYDLLEELLLRVPVREDKKGTTIFVSQDFDKKENLLILIHGSGAVRAGQWARRLIINNDLDSGTQLPYIRRALQLDWGVLVTNTNDNSDYKGCRSPPEHGAYVWKRFVKNSANKKIAIVAHSAGGHVCTTMLNENQRDFKNRVFAIAFTDSFGNPDYKNKEYFKKVTTNWVTSWHPLGTPIDERSLRHVSAGTTRHEETSHWAIEEVFQYIEDSFGSTVPGDAVHKAEKRDAFKRNAERLERDKAKKIVSSSRDEETDVDTGKRIKRDDTGATTNLNAVHKSIEKEDSMTFQQVKALRQAVKEEDAEKQAGELQIELTGFTDRNPLANKGKQDEKERAERERADGDRAEKEKAEREKAERGKALRERDEKDRLERERAERVEKDRLERERAERVEKDRLEREIAERKKAERERAERERGERERAKREKAERGKALRERDEKDRLEREIAERERAERERAERERAERERAERERAERERAERERAERERAERERAERVKTERERAERESTERFRAEKERAERERAEREKAERDIAERERAEREKALRERANRERAEKDRLEKEIAERERAEKERAERERAERVRAERERVERVKTEREKADRERAERVKAEQEKFEREKAERDRAERDKADRERVERERAEKERAERKNAKKIAETEEARKRLAQRMEAKQTKPKPGKPQQGETIKETTELKEESANKNPSERTPQSRLGKDAQKTSEKGTTRRQYASVDIPGIHRSGV